MWALADREKPLGIKKEYVCLAHGAFESDLDEPECPMGCDTVERAFFTPPGLGSGRTKNIDRTLDSLAKSHKLTDLGPAAMRRKALQSEKNRAALQDYCDAHYGGMGWGAVPKGATLNVKTGETEGSGAGAVGAVNKAGAIANPGLVGGIRDTFEGVKAVVTHKDPQNLTLADAKAA